VTKILVYDVDSRFLNQLKAAVTSLGYEAVVASDGYSVGPLAEQNRPALIILDFKLPEADGFEILKRLRSTATCASTPIIFASTTPKFEIEFVVMDAPSVGYIDKPLNVKQLKEAVESFLGAPKAAPKTDAAPPPMTDIPPPGAPLPPPAFNGEPDLDGTRDDIIELD
jgi:DNA-binding response OmpR family regulator